MKVTIGVPAKVLWYFSLIPRFYRIFKSNETCKMLTWHDENNSKDDTLSHPINSPSWKLLDSLSPQLGKESRNL